MGWVCKTHVPFPNRLVVTDVFSSNAIPWHFSITCQHQSRESWRCRSLASMSTDSTTVPLNSKNEKKRTNSEFSENKHDSNHAKGQKMFRVCDKLIEVFLIEKPQPSDWKKVIVYREEWNEIKPHFHRRCRARALIEKDGTNKKKILALSGKVKQIETQMKRHDALLKEIRENQSEVIAIVARQRKDFNEDFFEYLKLVANSYHGSLSVQDEISGLAASCLAAVQAYDNAVSDPYALNEAMNKLNDIFDSPSLDVACEKINKLAKDKQLDSTTLMLITQTWASAKNSKKVKNEAKEIMYQLYKVTKENLESLIPKEVQIIKNLLSIIDPEERLEMMTTAFSPGDENQSKDINALYTTPRKLRKWMKKILDAYYNNRNETSIKEAKQFMDPLAIQRIEYLMAVIEDEYL